MYMYIYNIIYIIHSLLYTLMINVVFAISVAFQKMKIVTWIQNIVNAGSSNSMFHDCSKNGKLS